ncbi:MAG TPA: transcription elongation factor GreA [Vicinamibacterales bacterium]|nr:transcription elongation factor GreA [Vicinamibacterales bacterium]
MKARILKRLEDEVAELERELRSDLPKEIKRARELGDLSENAEYQAARERQSYVQARLGMIRKRMAEISLMNLERLPTDRAAFGSTVTLREDGSDTRLVYQLVMPEDADATKGLISTSSPIGRAIVGRQVGDDITVPTPTGVRRFELVTLSTIHDEV